MPPRTTLRKLLEEGEHRLDAGRVEEAVEDLRAHPRKTEQLVECLWDDHPGTANRAAQAAEALTREKPALLQPWKAELLGLLGEATENKLRWSLAVIVPRLRLTADECERAADTLTGFFDASSSIVRTNALQGLADLCRQNPALLPQTLDLLRLHGRSGTPAMRARSRHLLRELEKRGPEGVAPPA
jgi:hypothetical protein